MTKIDRLQNTVSRAFGDDTTVLKCNDSYVLIRYNKGGSVEFGTFKHDWGSITSGNYFTAWGIAVDDYGSKEFKAVRDTAIKDYNNRIK